jgi:predicted amidohydrolase YtcJ
MTSLVLHDGKIVTVDKTFSIAQAVAISGDRVEMVGSDADVKQRIGPDTKVIDLAGKTVIPGVIDGHAHMDREGLKEILPSLAGVKSIDDVLQIIEAELKDKAPGEWLITMPIGDLPDFNNAPACLREGRFPT